MVFNELGYLQSIIQLDYRRGIKSVFMILLGVCTSLIEGKVLDNSF